MNSEDRLRDVLHDAGDGAVVGTPPSFADIERRAHVMRQRRLAGASAAAAVVLVLVGAYAVMAGENQAGRNVVTSPSPTEQASTTTDDVDQPSTTVADDQAAPETTAHPTTTTAAPTTTTVAEANDGEARAPDANALFTGDQGAAATKTAFDFAHRYLGMVRPVVGEFHEGDPTSGEVVVRPSDRKGAPETIVLLRRFTDERWSVIGAVARDIRVTAPEPGTETSGSVRVAGTGRAYEGHIDVEVRSFDEVLGRGFVTAGCCEDYESFEGVVEYRRPPQARNGAVVLSIRSAEDGSVQQATAIPIVLG